MPDNTSQAITAAKLRTTLIDLTNQIDTVQDDFETNITESVSQSISGIVSNDLSSSSTSTSVSSFNGKILNKNSNIFYYSGKGNSYFSVSPIPILRQHKYKVYIKNTTPDMTGVTSGKRLGIYFVEGDDNDTTLETKYTVAYNDTMQSEYTVWNTNWDYLRISMKMAEGETNNVILVDITEDYEDIRDYIFSEGTNNITAIKPEITSMTKSLVNANTGAITSSSSDVLSASITIPSGYSRIILMGTSVSASTNYGFAFYNSTTQSTSTFIPGGSKWVYNDGSPIYDVAIPEGAVSMATICKTSSSSINLDNWFVYAYNGDKISKSFQDVIDYVDAKQGSYTEKNALNTNSVSDIEFGISDGFDRYILKIQDGHIKTKNFDSSNVNIKKKIKILLIGNSYSCDVMAYTPWVLNNIDSDIEYEIGIAFYGGCSLEQHWEFINSDSASYTFYYYKTGQTSWTTQSSKTFSYIMNYADWEIITLQQRSTDSPVFSTYQPYLNNIIDKLFTYGKNFKLGWILTQASADNSGRFPDSSLDPNGDYQNSDDMYAGISQCTQQVLATTPISFVIPSGTAIQNARQNATLDAIGSFAPSGHPESNGQLTYDGYHLQEGLPSLIAAYTAVLFFLDLQNRGAGIYGNTIRPTAEWLSGKSIPNPQGTSIGVSDSNCRIAQKCALLAFSKPFEITNNIN